MIAKHPKAPASNLTKILLVDFTSILALCRSLIYQNSCKYLKKNMSIISSTDPISNSDSSSTTPAHQRPAEGITGDQSTSLFDEATVNLGSQTSPTTTTPNSTSQLTQSVTTAVSESSKSNSSTVDESTTPLASNIDSTSD